MSSEFKKKAEDLAGIMKIMADVWPGDREDIMVAGARLEDTMEGFEHNSGQIANLISLAWKGLIHLYEKDDYFQSVKSATLQGINTLREYAVRDGDIPVELFEKACDDLEKSMSGDSETVESMSDLVKESGDSAQLSLDDLASLIMEIDSTEDLAQHHDRLEKVLVTCMDKADDCDKSLLEEAQNILNAGRSGSEDPEERISWDEVLKAISERVEKIFMRQDGPEQGADSDTGQEESDGKQHEVADASATSTQGAGYEEQDFHIPEDADQELINEYITECVEQIETAESALLELETSPDDKELINQIFRSFHTIKGTSAFMGLTPISEFAHSVETLLDMVRDGVISFDSACADITLDAIDILKKLMEGVESTGNGERLKLPGDFGRLMNVLLKVSDFGISPENALKESPDGESSVDKGEQDEGELREEALKDSRAAPENIPEEKPEVEPQVVSDTPDPGESTPLSSQTQSREPVSGNGSPASKAETESTVRVNVNRLDRLIDMVGELVIAHSVVAQDRTINSEPELNRKMSHSTKILRELQDTSLTLRMVPLKATFNKMNRLVRDLGKKGAKTVRLETTGEDTEIDRNMVDIINEPLVHLLRNAIDHGIEDQESREKSGKPGIATISLRAFQAGGKVVIEIEDDGRGMDRTKILDKAISKGLIDKNKKLTDGEVYKLIFLPGFSTADKVTDLSGRGVGMDVVRRSIENLHGKVDVTSEPGKGTKISLELPFTLAITDGMLIGIGNQRFIVPTINIDMTFRAEEQDLFTVMSTGEHVMFRGQSIPVIRLHKMFGIENGVENILDGTLLVINNNKKKYALLVDEVIGQQQLVGKSIDMPVKMKNISGGAILGDGRVGLILDTVTLLN